MRQKYKYKLSEPPH